MRTIQEVGLEILNKNPNKFYIFLGKEYKLKQKYIDVLKEYYHNNYKEVDTFDDINAITKGRSLLVIPPTVYVIRYDRNFVKQLSDTTKVFIERMSLSGTLVFIYESDVDAKKLDKYLSEYTVTFYPLNIQLQKKYLIKDYPTLSESTIDMVLRLNRGYNNADDICRVLSKYENADKLSQQDIMSTFVFNIGDVLTKLQLSFADRNGASILCIIDDVDISQMNLHYKFLSVLIEIMKLQKSPYIDSPYKKYVTKWGVGDVYRMFNVIYDELVKLRTITSDINNSIMRIAILLYGGF